MTNLINRRSFLGKVLAVVAVLVIPKKFRHKPDNKQFDLNTVAVGEHGGFLVPPEFRDSILELAKNNQVIRGQSITVHSDDTLWVPRKRKYSDDTPADTLITVTILDTETGEVAHSKDSHFANRNYYYWAEGNGCCDCNRELVFSDGRETPAGRCLGESRYLIIKTSAGNLDYLNQSYPQELVDRYLNGDDHGDS